MLPDIKLDNVLTYGSEGQYYTTNLRLATNGMALTLDDTRDDERVTLDNNLLNIRINLSITLRSDYLKIFKVTIHVSNLS